MEGRCLKIVISTLLIFSLLHSAVSAERKRIEYYPLGDGYVFLGESTNSSGNVSVYSNAILLPSGVDVVNVSIEVVEYSVAEAFKGSISSDFYTSPLEYSMVKSRGNNILNYSFIPFFEKNGIVYKIDVYSVDFQRKIARVATRATKQSSVSKLKTGKWVKVRFKESGVYKITGADLQSYGFTSVQTVQLFGDSGAMLPMENGTILDETLPEIPLQIVDGNDGVFDPDDYILFYGQSPHKIYFDGEKYRHSYNCYSEYSYVLITVNAGQPKRVRTSSVSASSAVNLDYFDDVQFYESNDTNLVRSGRQWVGTTGDRTYSFSFPNAVSSKSTDIECQVVTSYESTFHYRLEVNGKQLSYSFSPSANTDHTQHTALGAVAQSSSTTSVAVKKETSGHFWLDYLLLSVPCSLKLRNGQLAFRNKEQEKNSSVSFSFANSGVTLWDVTDFNEVISISLTGNSATVYGGKCRDYVAFDNSAYLKPEFVGSVENQDLLGMSGADMIIVAHPDLASEARRLASYHKTTDGISYSIVSQEQIFNEFSSGRPDVTAIRNYFRYMYVNNKQFRYTLLFGDGSYDNRNLLADNTIIGTYQSYKSLSSTDFVSDDYFGLLDEGEGEVVNTTGDIEYRELAGALDVGIGRIPVSNTEQARTVVNKILHYANAEDCRGRWRNNMVFLADDGDNDLHMEQSDLLTDYIVSFRGEMLFDKIFSDAYPKVASAGGSRYPAVNEKLNDAIKKGMLVFNYTGHGNPVQLADERFLTVADVNLWKNYDELPLVITGSCEVSRYDDHSRRSLGEQMLLHDEGGAVALFSTTRLVYAGRNFTLNKQLYSYLFADGEDGKPNRLGDVIRKAKVAVGNDFNKRNFSLLGDPALTLAYPSLDVVTDSINGIAVSQFSDTVSALQEVRVSGHIERYSGSVLSTYNGIVYPTVLDKSRYIKGMDHADDGEFGYDDQVNILFKGKATVRNGRFSFRFLVPKDIMYAHGRGKISYYADNGFDDASGADTTAIVGGSGSIDYSDNYAPELLLYMNDTTFVFGGTTNESPMLIVKVMDSSGVNITGNSVGHDLTATLDNDQANVYVLNDFYEADLDSYRKGSVEYQMSDLDEGKHSVRVKVWDAVNNSSEDFLEFYVAESEKMALKHVLNYPNPFTTKTEFSFEHNQAGQQIDILIQIFTVSGKLVKTLSASQFARGYRCDDLLWDGLDDYGDRLGRGVYIYRVKVRSEDGGQAEVYEKLVLLR